MNHNNDTTTNRQSDTETTLVERVERPTRAAETIIRGEVHLGPIPAPAQFEQYERTFPGTAKIIIDEFQSNSHHVREMEKLAISTRNEQDHANRKAAQWLVAASLVCVLILALTGHDGVAGTVAVSTIAAVIAGFLRREHAPANKPDPNDHQSS